MLWLNALVSIFGVAMAALVLWPRFSTLRTEHLAWVAFAALIAILPWLPISKLAFGGTSIELFKQQTQEVDRTFQKQFADYAKAMNLTLAQLKAEIDYVKATQEGAKAKQSDAEKRLSNVSQEAARARASYAESARAAAQARSRLDDEARYFEHLHLSSIPGARIDRAAVPCLSIDASGNCLLTDSEGDVLRDSNGNAIQAGRPAKPH